jgi:asparagine synthase (glutamine-hydrolysing)
MIFMCGIAGFIGLGSVFDFSIVAQNMGKALKHRGPDSNGQWIDEQHQVALVHQRLSIIDLSVHGHQPMHSVCQRYVMVFNGEIYNHQMLRSHLEEMEPIVWRGHSDTETLLCAFRLWGVPKTLSLIIGMFAIALWDRQEKKLYLMRDRIGEKPLYYGFVNGHLVFSSELKAFKHFPGFKPEINLDALYQYLALDYIPAPLSIYQNIFKLKPGTYFEIGYQSETKVHDYWRLQDVVEQAKKNPLMDESLAVEQVKASLTESVKIQGISDVPLGAFLSGGIDSTTVVALMQSQTPKAIQTFTIGFDEKSFDESSLARQVAKHLGTEHHELILRLQDCQNMIPALAKIYDEPFADSSQIPTFFVSQMAHQKVKVAISGDAGDELFGGYSRYQLVPKAWQTLKYFPKHLRKMIAQGVMLPSMDFYDQINSLLPASYQLSHLGQKVYKLGNRLASFENVDDLYFSMLTKSIDPIALLAKQHQFRTGFFQKRELNRLEDIVDRMMFLDSIYYLPDDILTKVDRASMAVSLETRVPFLDPRVIEMAWRLPKEMKIRHGKGKWVLRKILQEYLPIDLIERPKMGFGIPLCAWLRGDLKAWVESLIEPHKLAMQGLLNPEYVQKMWREHQSGQRDWSSFLWNICMFQAWYEEHL